MAEIKILKEVGEEIIPITHEDAVLDSNGYSIPLKYVQTVDYDQAVDIQVDLVPNELEEKIDQSNQYYEETQARQDLIEADLDEMETRLDELEVMLNSSLSTIASDLNEISNLL